MIRKLIVLTSVVFVLGLGASIVSAQGWEDLGSKEVKDRSEQDTWHLGKGKATFKALKLSVEKKPVRFYRLRVTYENGQTQEIQLADTIRAGGQSRVLDLNGGDRWIDKVDIWYEANTARRGVRSQVTLHGRR